jgi:hypothetical protein
LRAGREERLQRGENIADVRRCEEDGDAEVAHALAPTSQLAMQARQRIEDLCALRRFAIAAEERLRGREFLLRVASLQREPLHRHQGMADAEPFDEVRIGQRIVRRRPVGVCEFVLGNTRK